MIDKARAELGAAGVTDQPAVVLADAGYWHGEQIDQLMGQGVRVLIPPDADKRRGTRPGWDGGRYAFMRNVLDSPAAGQLYAQRMIESAREARTTSLSNVVGFPRGRRIYPATVRDLGQASAL
jgi:hypothetical protein